ncbi:hypothetical protein DQ04_00011220 [Trypanosoma grayi]|uniref:hypothetical protein n=1 Tax=Trypanosoma grayi TaxID=71804 RepID=UPI0004F438B1|nr:hypothetical protein DQ04_00011220 [Trypanosoma grayi]KEG15655.1 hypothetical protein DQ04_00011220 [Trypanosoma grayi]
MVEHSREPLPHEARRVFLRELIGTFTPVSKDAGSPMKSQLPLPLRAATLALSPRALNSSSSSTCEMGSLSTSTPLMRNRLPTCGEQNTCQGSTEALPSRASPIIANGSQNPRRRRFNNVAPKYSGDATSVLSSSAQAPIPETPMQSIVTTSSHHSSASSSIVLQGAGGGRRIFKRVGMSCVYDMYGDESGFTQKKSVSKEAQALSSLHSQENESNTPYVRPQFRQSLQSPPSSQPEGKNESRLVHETLQPSPVPATQKVAKRDGARKPDFNGSHRRRRNCPFHKVVNEEDLSVAELSHSDSSHYIRSYPLTCSVPVGGTAPEPHSEDRPQLDRRHSFTGRCGESGAAPPTPKTSVMLTRTLSNLRTKQHSGGRDVSSLSRGGSFSKTPQGTNGNRPATPTSPKRTSQRHAKPIIQEEWGETGSNSSSRCNSGATSARSFLSDNDSCCSCCSCFVQNRRQARGVSSNGTKKRFPASPGNDPCDTPKVAYNNFFDDEDIPALSMHSFRRSSVLSSKMAQDLR